MQLAMKSDVREYIDFWVDNSIHAAEPSGTGASQDVGDLVRRLIDGANSQGISEDAMQREVGNLGEFLRNKLALANRVERERRK